jgi:glyoxylase-like metal-dependent hydrolase (beta-lactamase superfamily II)
VKAQAFATSIEGNRQLLDGGAMFGNVPRPVWEKWIAPDTLGRIPLACRCLLLEFNGLKVLCETGIGAFFDPKMSERFGVQTPGRHILLENLEAAGHSPESIDFVILSHLHFDHAGGLLPTYNEMSAGKVALVFPKAQFLVGDEAWARAIHPHSRDRASFIPGLTDKLRDSGRLIRIPSEPLPKELVGWVEFIESAGHTPGQMHTLFKGPEQIIFFCGDLIPGRPWVHLPITMGYDRFPEQLIDEKAGLYQRAVPEKWLLFFTHDPEMAAGQVQQNTAGKFQPVEVEKSLQRRPL